MAKLAVRFVRRHTPPTSHTVGRTLLAGVYDGMRGACCAGYIACSAVVEEGRGACCRLRGLSVGFGSVVRRVGDVGCARLI